MNATMKQIQALSDERQSLWARASRRELDDEGYWRLQQISKELDKLWDSYRRQRATANWGSRRGKVTEPEFVSLDQAA